jgi:hypothetical protein
MAGGGGMYPSGSLSETITAASYCFQAVNASANARSPGVPFSKAKVARRQLVHQF